MVEVFKTNVRLKKESMLLLKILLEIFPKYKIDFDLDDCDKVLRIEGIVVQSGKVINALKEQGFSCSVLQ
jgi:hypothetical protein